ncbi:fusicoccadiene synthase [Hypoxylon sp. FL0543]|nr:fusicoccadiene synthase [Hypoxylon sp. FL0543]
MNGITIRIHEDPIKEIQGTLRAQKDWSEYVQPLQNYHGGLGDPYSFMRITVPECLPERLEILGYANEFAFLYDDNAENLDTNSNPDESARFLEPFDQGILNQRVDLHSRPEKRLQVQVLSEMMAIDSARAVTAMKAWGEFVCSAARCRAPFTSMKEYVPARIIDAGELIWFGFLTFGMALTIPDEELELCTQLAKPGYAALGLTNDLYSWEKERRAAEQAGKDYVFNAVWVITKERSTSEEEAKMICREEITKYISQYCHTVEEIRVDTSLSRTFEPISKLSS